YERYGPAAEVLRVGEVERPEPGPGEVVVKVVVSGVNPTDWKSRSGATPRPIDGFQIPHHDGAGVVEAVGDGVDPARVGQRVWLWMSAGGRGGGGGGGGGRGGRRRRGPGPGGPAGLAVDVGGRPAVGDRGRVDRGDRAPGRPAARQ